MTPFIAQVMLFAGNFAPRGWALCDGQLMAISSNTALFSIIGTTYGGDGVSTFALPDLRSRAAVHMGTGPGLSHYTLGQKGGAENVTLTSAQMPTHSHILSGSSANGSLPTVANNTMATSGTSAPPSGPYSSDPPNAPMNGAAIGKTGGNASHSNIQPYLTMNYVIALEGIYPSRS